MGPATRPGVDSDDDMASDPHRIETAEAAIAHLTSLAEPDAREGMARFGINTDRALGLPMPVLRSTARLIGRDQVVAEGLWRSGLHEARILAALVAEPKVCDIALLDRWVEDLDSWDVTDQFCLNLVRRTADPYAMIGRWCPRRETFVRRAGFALIACLAVHDKRAPDARFLDLLQRIEAAADDDRNFVKKAVNWALRQIGKRNAALNRAALTCAEGLIARPEKASQWIGRDALRELTSDKVQARLAR